MKVRAVAKAAAADGGTKAVRSAKGATVAAPAVVAAVVGTSGIATVVAADRRATRATPLSTRGANR